MSSRAPSVSAFGGAAGGALLWRRRGELFLTATVKAALALSHDEVASLAPAQELSRADVPYGDATRPLEQMTDLSPPLPSPEILLVGHACAPGQRPVPSMSVRLFVGREEQALLDKTVHVYGDRPSGAVQPLPFVRMPLSYALAVGGPNTDNPVGRSLNDPTAPPNVVDPHSPWACAGFAPIAPTWPSRLRAVRSSLPHQVAHVLELPVDLQMDYFQASPLDQRVPLLNGDEWIVIDGMHPEKTRFQSQLPGLKARARLARGGLSEPLSFALVLDRLFIDMDRWSAQLSWRGTMRVELAELADAQLIVGLESTADEDMELSSETMMLSEDQLSSAMEGQALPWELEPPPPRKSSSGRAFGGLPFKPPVSAAPGPSPSVPGAMPFPTQMPATATALPTGALPAAPKFGRPPIQIANEATITSVDDQGLAALPFGRPSERSPNSFQVARALEEDDDSDGGETKVAPILSLPDSPFPFGVRPVAPLAEATPAAAIPPAPIPEPIVPPRMVNSSWVRPSGSGPSALREDAERIATPLPALFGDPQRDQEISAPVVVEPLPGGPSALVGTGLGGLALGAAKASEPASEPPPAHASVPSPAHSEPPPSRLPLSPEEALKKLVLDNIRNEVSMYDMDLSGADLADLDLRGAVFSGAKLLGANLNNSLLRDARLSNAKLSGALLHGADLHSADLTGADLSRADLGDSIFDHATVTGANFSGAQAKSARFVFASADRAQFVQAVLEGAVLDGASLRDADFSGAVLSRASFRDAKAAGAIFSEVRGEAAVFDEADLAGASFAAARLPDLSCVAARASRSNWERAELERSSFDRTDLSSANMVRATLEVGSLRGADLTKADLSNVAGDGADFTEANLSGADLRMSKLSDARFENAKLCDANAQKMLSTDARMCGADLSRASFRSARMKGCDFANANLEGADLRDADLEGAKLEGVDTTRTKLAGANLKGVEGVSS